MLLPIVDDSESLESAFRAKENHVAATNRGQKELSLYPCPAPQ